MNPRPRAGRVLLAAAAVGIGAALLLEGVLSAGLVVGPGPAETGQGAFVGENSLVYWSWQGTRFPGMPAGLTPVSLRAAVPTLLPQSGSVVLRVGFATAGNASTLWSFAMATTAPASTELELQFLAGAGSASVVRVAYVLTPALAPTGTVVVSFYLDVGGGSTAPLVLATASESSQVCAMIGNCP